MNKKYFAPLDGVRAMSLIAVLLFHSNLDICKGGFLGVETFFVISGFIITTLLMGEYAETSQIHLRGFYVRRLKRLVPEMLVMIVLAILIVCILYPEEIKKTVEDLIPSLTYTSNWFYILNDSSYFESSGRPKLFKHLWSLSVEFQYYMVYPFVFIILSKFSAKKACVLSLIAAFASSFYMSYLFSLAEDVSRIYYGTDTRASALFIGGALAFIFPLLQKTALKNNTMTLKLSIFSFITLMIFYVALDNHSEFLYYGGFPITSILSAILIASSIINEDTIVSKILSSKFMIAIGKRAYSLYIWHWPVFSFAQPYIDIWIDGWPLFCFRMMVTILLSEISYKLVNHASTKLLKKRTSTCFYEIPESYGISKSSKIVMVLSLCMLLIFGSYFVTSDKNLYITSYSTKLASSQNELLALYEDKTASSSQAENIENIKKNEEVQIETLATNIPESVIESPLNERIDPKTQDEINDFSLSFLNENIVLKPNEEIGNRLKIKVLSKIEQNFIINWSQDINGQHHWEDINSPMDSGCPSWYSWSKGKNTISVKISNGTSTKIFTTTVNIEKVEVKATSIPSMDNKKNNEKAYVSVYDNKNGYIHHIHPSSMTKKSNLIIGDSVMLVTSIKIYQLFSDYVNIDAKVSRQLPDAKNIIEEFKNNNMLGNTVIIHLGTNNYITKKQLYDIMKLLEDTEKVVFFNFKVPRPWEKNNNDLLTEISMEYEKVKIIDWKKLSTDTKGNFGSDGIHLTKQGVELYSKIISESIQKN